MGAEGAGGSIPVEVGLGSRRPPIVTLWRSDKAGSRPPRREVGLALVGVRGYLTRLTRSGYLIRVWPFGLYALTTYAGAVIVSATSLYQPKHFWTSAAERRASGWTA